MTPPLRKCRGPAAYCGDGIQLPTDSSPSQWLFSCNPSGLSAPQPQQKLSFIASWKADTAHRLSVGRRWLGL